MRFNATVSVNPQGIFQPRISSSFGSSAAPFAAYGPSAHQRATTLCLLCNDFHVVVSFAFCSS